MKLPRACLSKLHVSLSGGAVGWSEMCDCNIALYIFCKYLNEKEVSGWIITVVSCYRVAVYSLCLFLVVLWVDLRSVIIALSV